MKHWLFSTVWAAVLALLLQSAHAQSPSTRSEEAASTRSGEAYPVRPVRVIVGLGPGGGTDVVARMIAQKLSESLRQSFVVENRTGASGTIAYALVAKSPPDGYTLLMVPGDFSTHPALYPNLPYDPISDFAPITLVSKAPFMLVVHPSVPVKTIKELIALAKARPGELGVGMSGIGATGDLVNRLFQSMAGIKFTNVPFRGSGPAMTALLGGNVELAIGSIMSSLPHVKSGRLRALGVTSTERSPVVPHIPTISESGVSGFEATNWYGLVAPKGTPVPIVNKVRAEVGKVLATPELANRLRAEGAVPTGSAPEQFAQHLIAEGARWRKVINDAGIRVH